MDYPAHDFAGDFGEAPCAAPCAEAEAVRCAQKQNEGQDDDPSNTGHGLHDSVNQPRERERETKRTWTRTLQGVSNGLPHTTSRLPLGTPWRVLGERERETFFFMALFGSQMCTTRRGPVQVSRLLEETKKEALDPSAELPDLRCHVIPWVKLPSKGSAYSE